MPKPTDRSSPGARLIFRIVASLTALFFVIYAVDLTWYHLRLAVPRIGAANSSVHRVRLLAIPDKGNKIEYVGREDVEGKSDYKLKLTNKNGDTSFFLFDPDTYLISKWEGTRKVGDKDVPWESFFRDFREVDGLKYPFLIESDAPGTEQIQKIAADKIEVNVPIEDSRFGKPTPPVAPPAPAAEPADPAKPQ